MRIEALPKAPPIGITKREAVKEYGVTKSRKPAKCAASNGRGIPNNHGHGKNLTTTNSPEIVNNTFNIERTPSPSGVWTMEAFWGGGCS